MTGVFAILQAERRQKQLLLNEELDNIDDDTFDDLTLEELNKSIPDIALPEVTDMNTPSVAPSRDISGVNEDSSLGPRRRLIRRSTLTTKPEDVFLPVQRRSGEKLEQECHSRTDFQDELESLMKGVSEDSAQANKLGSLGRMGET